jgi:6-phosphogluconolactonase
MTMQSLFGAGLPDQCQLFRMEGESSNVSEAARRYQKVLPERIDVLLLSVGEDGHIASLFPNHPALFELSRKVLAVVGPHPPYERLTITPRVIVSSQTVFVFVRGRRKGAVLAEALKDPVDVSSLPVRMTIDGTWIMDHEAVLGLKAAMEGSAVRPLIPGNE